MSTADAQFVQAVVAEAKQSGRTFSRDVLKGCYCADLKLCGATELPAVSEKWIDLYIAIDPNSVNSELAEVWQTAPRVSGVNGLPYQRSIWSQEVTIYQTIPQAAIIGPVKP
ncbi:hypothetical protein [Paludibacterium sp. B53371]|uniref:hypothetical protein n=1 Tax=Paludibacterium sp. B53371 TaxID=2806263 RepID=UPI001C059CB5|nr:hypothetical protein [Paludibacterium sp. B53371]